MNIIDLAPNAFLPPKDGSARRAWHLFEEITRSQINGTFIGMSSVVRSGNDLEKHSQALSWRDRKMLAAMVSLITGMDYWALKMIRPGVRRALEEAVRRPYDTIILNFLYSFPLLAHIPKPYRLLVDTHNYDPAFYRTLAGNTQNLGLRILCQRAVNNSERALLRLPKGTVMVHVSARDSELYSKHRPDLEHVVVENGTKIKPRKCAPDYAGSGKRILMFVGSLSAKMNQDALVHFARHFWPRLREKAELRVVGSMPTEGVRTLCVQEGWVLHSNVSEEQLDCLYDQSHFAILPFVYGEGSKLKLFEACGHGVPILATRAGSVGVADLPSLVTVSDDANAWHARIMAFGHLSAQDATEMLAFVEEYSWKQLAAKLVYAAKHAPLIT